MDHHNQLQSNQQAQPVLLVQSPMAQADDGISIADVAVVFLKKIKWFVILWFLCFFVSFLVIFWQNQKVVYKQLVALPTIMNVTSLQRQPLFPVSDLLGDFYAKDVMYWQNNPRFYINKSFQYAVASKNQTDDSGTQVPEGSLMLSIKAPVTNQSDVERLFAASVTSLQQIVDARYKDWRSAMQTQISNDQSMIVSLQAALSQKNSSADNISRNAAPLAQMQAELIQAKRKLSQDKWLMASAKKQVKLTGSLYISNAKSLQVVLLLSLVVASMLALVIMFMICAMIISFQQQARQRS